MNWTILLTLIVCMGSGVLIGYRMADQMWLARCMDEQE